MGRMLSLILLVALGLPIPSTAQQLPTLPAVPLPDGSDDVRIYVLLGQWRRLADDRIEVQTRAGTWMQSPPDGMRMSGKPILATGFQSLDVRLPRTRLDEIRRIIENEIPPRKIGPDQRLAAE